MAVLLAGEGGREGDKQILKNGGGGGGAKLSHIFKIMSCSMIIYLCQKHLYK